MYSTIVDRSNRSSTIMPRLSDKYKCRNDTMSQFYDHHTTKFRSPRHIGNERIKIY